MSVVSTVDAVQQAGNLLPSQNIFSEVQSISPPTLECIMAANHAQSRSQPYHHALLQM